VRVVVPLAAQHVSSRKEMPLRDAPHRRPMDSGLTGCEGQETLTLHDIAGKIVFAPP
jgi:hypothetical protein